jgi:formylglycine-generating enzyme required for sulfatase activity
MVTNAHYEAFDAQHARCETSSGDDDPVVNVSFREAEAYCAWYAALSNKAFRLPTDAEWTFACRAGRDAPPWGDDAARAGEFAWLAESSGGRTHEVETLKANAFGLHDLLGLAWEWTAPGILRGGSFRTSAREVGCALRRVEDEDARFDDAGFRIVRAL